ncbi:MAG: aldehyde oxidase and xanthine dehydrogenase molybdopterin binding protein [Mucilaginibacter sp.]|nr:aldehyde oxidase and xanthine dehydrogenase molybdopterin binding protein [Mucilaginibacter sp.]
MKVIAPDKDGIKRVDGRLKVTGAIRYAAEYNFPGLVYGVLVNSTVAKGTMTAINGKAAEKAPGVLAVISHLNVPEVSGYKDGKAQPGSPFYNNQVFFNGQPVVLVIANTLERAKYGASLIKITYKVEPHQTNLDSNLQNAVKTGDDYMRGIANAYQSAPVKIEVEYRTPIHVHNAMEPFAVTSVWDGDKVTLYTKSQYIKGMQQDVMKLFNLPEANVQVYSKVIGGAFGSGSPLWPYAKAALIGSKVISKPLKVVIDREQMFTMVGYRSPAVQKIGMGASADGKLIGITHDAIGETATYQRFTEGITNTTCFLYDCPNVNTTYKLANLDLSVPTYTRGPGETTGVFALESAVDELAYALNMDPLGFRLKNYAETDLEQNLPFSSKYLRECYKQGAAQFGWNKRNQKPRSVVQNGWLVGYGLSTGAYWAGRAPSTAKARLSPDGILLIQSATSDMGPGTATVMTKIASEIINIPVENIKIELGSSALPPAAGEYGSMTTSSVGSSVYDVCTELKRKFNELGGNNDDNPNYVKILQDHKLPYLEVTRQSHPDANSGKYSSHAYNVNFVEAHVHPATGMVKIVRVVSVIDGGKILNPITARSQIIGGVVWGISMALMEGGVIDHRYGKYVNSNLGEYHVATNADVPQIEVIFIDKKDPVTNPMGSKGIGEVGIVGVAAAMANAVFNATGIRVRDLPITPDKLVQV